MSRRIIEVDTDGVLANMDGGYEPYLRKFIPDFTEEKYIDDWGMPKVQKLCPEAFNVVQGLWKDYDYMRNLKRLPDVEYGFQILNNLDFDVVIHTHIFSDEAATARREWLEDLMIDADTNFDIDICQGAVKSTLENPYITIEDNIKNLNKSNAKIKILIRRCHNRNVKLTDITGGEIRFICNSFYEAAQKIALIENSKNEVAAY